jgi:hypothetical protein
MYMSYSCQRNAPEFLPGNAVAAPADIPSHLLDGLVDPALCDEHKRRGEHRLKELGQEAGIQPWIRTLVSITHYALKALRGLERLNGAGGDDLPETPSDWRMWRTALSEEAYLCVAACYDSSVDFD